MPEPVAELAGVSKSFGNFRRTQVLSGLDLRLEAGVSYGLLGRNGSGKTTALRLLAGLLRPTKGTARIFGGDPIAEAERVKVHLGYLAEDQAYPPSLRAVDLFRFFEDCYPTWDRELLRSLVERFRIPVDRKLATLSKGQARQVALACAVAHRPRLLILDEPGGGLDPVVRRGFLEEVIGLLASERTTVLFSSHNLQEVERIATRVGILHGGRIIIEDDLDHLRENSSQILAELDGLEVSAIRKRLPACAGARRLRDGWLLTLLEPPERARESVAASLGGRVLDARPASLEELFLAIAGEDP